jgi:hypothetical protein
MVIKMQTIKEFLIFIAAGIATGTVIAFLLLLGNELAQRYLG